MKAQYKRLLIGSMYVEVEVNDGMCTVNVKCFLRSVSCLCHKCSVVCPLIMVTKCLVHLNSDGRVHWYIFWSLVRHL